MLFINMNLYYWFWKHNALYYLITKKSDIIM